MTELATNKISLRCEDNSSLKGQLSPEALKELIPLSGIPLKELATQYKKLLIFPQSLGHHNDGIEDQVIYSLYGENLKTGNVAGFVGIGKVQLAILSRFDKGKNQYFIHYMLQKVLGINMVDFSTATDKEGIWNFLLHLFPHYLMRAIQQGIFKRYQRFTYNDSKVRGVIDIPRHLRQNVPFAAKIAYQTREHSVDNPLTQLIRHTLEHIRADRTFGEILSLGEDIREAVRIITEATPRYNYHDRARIIGQNLRPTRHPYFTEYSFLQKLCLQILRHEKHSFGKDESEIHGILFDISWLWEEYLATLMPPGFEHPRNKCRTGKVYIYEQCKTCYVYPDFLREKIVLDAKYKYSHDRHDRFQMISYLHITDAKKGYFICPVQDKEPICKPEGILRGFGGEIGVIQLQIPGEASSFTDFISKNNVFEEKFIDKLESLYTT